MDAIVDLFHQHSRRLAALTCIVMVLLMSASAARTTWFFIDNLSEQTMAPAETRQPRRGTGTASETIDLASLNLFGRVDEQATQVVDAPETRLNLELQGVFTAEERNSSTAIVAERNKSGELYRIGDRLPGNATLTDVFDNYILIRRGNRVEKLAFEDSTFRQAGIPASAQSSRAETRTFEQVRNRVANRSRDDQFDSDDSLDTGEESFPDASIRDHVEQYRQRLDEDPDSVMQELGIESVDTGEATGYRVGSDVSHNALQRAGLQQGDVILSLNGQPVGEITNDRSLVDQALAAGSVRVEVQRGSRRFYLTVPIPSQ